MKAGSGRRFLDWNPDVKVANRYGVSIRYDSDRNLIHSPELRTRRGAERFAFKNVSSGRTSPPIGGGGDTTAGPGVVSGSSAASGRSRSTASGTGAAGSRGGTNSGSRKK
jgi:hypothetical protein